MEFRIFLFQRLRFKKATSKVSYYNVISKCYLIYTKRQFDIYSCDIYYST